MTNDLHWIGASDWEALSLPSSRDQVCVVISDSNLGKEHWNRYRYRYRHRHRHRHKYRHKHRHRLPPPEGSTMAACGH